MSWDEHAFARLEGEYEFRKQGYDVRGVGMTEWHEVSGGVGAYWNRETPIEGTYVEKREGVGQYQSMLYILKTDDGNIGVNGTSVIDSKFAQLVIGQEVRIEPLGETKSEKTGRTYQDFRVLAREAPMMPVGEEEKPPKKKKAEDALKEAGAIDISGDEIPFHHLPYDALDTTRDGHRRW